MVERKISLTLKKEVYKKLEKQSKKKGISRSQVVENALNNYLKKNWFKRIFCGN